MGQKVNPTGFRVGVKIRTGENQKRNVQNWRSCWYAGKKDFSRCLIEDQKIRKFIKKEFRSAGIPKIEILRRGEELTVCIHTARPGLIIGRKGAKVEKLRSDIEAIVGHQVAPPKIIQVENPEIEAQLVAEGVAEQLEKRAGFRRVVKKTLDAIQANLKLHRIQCVVHADYTQSRKWVERLGFIEEGLLNRYGPDQASYYMYGRCS